MPAGGRASYDLRTSMSDSPAKSGIRFILLGTGTSSGVPAIACSCAVCTSTDPRDNRLRAGAAVCFTDPSGHERVVLIDATPDLRQQALRAGLMRCDAVLFTHNHVDHTFGVDELRRFNAVQRSPIDIYAEPRTLEHLQRVYKHIFERENNIQESFVATLIPHAIRMPDHAQTRDEPVLGGAGTPIDLFGVRFTPIRLLHGRLPILGYRIEPSPNPQAAIPTPQSPFPLAYCTDVSAIPPRTWRELTGLGTLVLDALRHRKHPTHFTLEEAIDAAARIGARRTLFTHMSHDLGHAATNPTLPASMQLAFDGLTVE